MTDQPDAKEKRSSSYISRDTQGYAALAGALCLCTGLALLMQVTYNWSREATFFYPLLLLSHESHLVVFLAGSIIALTLVLLAFAMWRGIVLLALLFGVFCTMALAAAFLFWALGSQILSVQNSLVYEGQMHHLVIITNPNQDQPTREYRVLRCDEAGLMCHGYANPYQYTDLWYRFEGFDTSGQLIIADQSLYLKLGETLYLMGSGTHIETEDNS